MLASNNANMKLLVMIRLLENITKEYTADS